MPRIDTSYHPSDVFRYWNNLSRGEVAELLILETIGLALLIGQSGNVLPGMSNITQAVGKHVVLLYTGEFAEFVTDAISSGMITINDNFTNTDVARVLRGLSARSRRSFLRILDKNPL